MYRKYVSEKQISKREGEMEQSVTRLLKLLFEQEQGRADAFLDSEDLKELLCEDYSEDAPRESIFGYPTHPLYREYGILLSKWMTERQCPALELPSYDLLDEKSHKESRADLVSQITPKLSGLLSLWDNTNEEEKIFRFREILQLLGKRGLLDLLGMRKTVGTFDYWPPPRRVIEETFHQKHSEKAGLTVGARALAKHCHRDESSSWWGKSTGTEAQKNEHASSILKQILDNSSWINMHQLPHDVRIIEVRQENGYGARWTSDGKSFRGFLEPQMVDGHEVGWKH